MGGWAPPPPPPSTGDKVGITIGMAFVGLTVYSVINAILGFFVFLGAISTPEHSRPMLIAGTVTLVGLGLVAGLVLVLIRRPWTRGIGMGLMIGWALWSICTAGLCTGLNPALYGA